MLSWLLLLSLPSMASFELWIDVRAGGGQQLPPTTIAAFDRQLLESDSALTGPAQLAVQPAGQLFADGDVLVGACVGVGSADAQSDALSLVGSVDWLYVETAGGAPMITAENILAAAEGTPTRLAVPCAAAAEVNGLAFALERGVDALVVAASMLANDAGGSLFEALQIAKAQRLERAAADDDGAAGDDNAAPLEGETLVPTILTSVVNGGVADRVCLDLTRLLNEGEGCLLGSSAKLLALVLGETAQSGYVPPRPFRVNAGPVHQYVLMAEPPGATKYLSEVVAGDVVLAVDGATGRGRGITVGRAKVEPRPMLKIDFRLNDKDGVNGQLFLQQAETVRLGTVGRPLPVTAAAAAMSRADAANLPRLRVRASSRGTHVGRAIKARVTER